MSRPAVWGLLAAVLSVPAAAGGPERTGEPSFVVVAHPAVPREEIRREELAGIFLGEVDRWDDGTEVTAVDLSASSETRRHFSSRVLRRTLGEVIRHWRRTPHRDRVPRVVSSEPAAVERVAATPGAVGYVSPETPRRGVRVLALRD